MLAKALTRICNDFVPHRWNLSRVLQPRRGRCRGAARAAIVGRTRELEPRAERAEHAADRLNLAQVMLRREGAR